MRAARLAALLDAQKGTLVDHPLGPDSLGNKRAVRNALVDSGHADAEPLCGLSDADCSHGTILEDFQGL
jgi:hypothetical protein